MTKRTTISKEVRRTIRLKFLTDTGKNYTISLNCASAKLAGADGVNLVKRVMEKILEYDIFTVKLVKLVSAELAERRVIFAPDAFQIDEGRAEREAASEAEAQGQGGGSGDFELAAATRRTPGQGARSKQPAAPAACASESGMRCSGASRGLTVERFFNTLAQKQPMEANSAAATRSPPFLHPAGTRRGGARANGPSFGQYL